MDDSTYDIREEVFNRWLQEAAEQTAKERNKPIADIFIARNTEIKYCGVLGVESGLAETTTDARAAACSELRNQVSMAAMVKSYDQIHPLLVMNFDSTAFTVGGSGADDVEVKYAKNAKPDKGPGPSRGRQVMPSETDKGFVKYTIKYTLLMNAAGMQAAPIYLIADDNMTTEEFRACGHVCLPPSMVER
jgi:hypothetical protein